MQVQKYFNYFNKLIKLKRTKQSEFYRDLGAGQHKCGNGVSEYFDGNLQDRLAKAAGRPQSGNCLLLAA